MRVAVVGAGPAGIAAAVAARGAGAEVVVVDSQPEPGGQIWRGGGGRSQALLRSGAELRLGWSVWAVEDGALRITDGERGDTLRADAIVLATGAYDRPVAFPGWTLPGVLTAGGAQALAKGQGVLPGRRVLLAGAGPFLFPVARELRALGAEVTVAEATRRREWLRAAPRMTAHPDKLAAFLRERVPVRWGRMIVRAEGGERVERATIAEVDGDWRPGAEETLAVDTVCTAYGFLPSLELPRALGCEIRAGAVAHDGAMATSVAGVYVAGEAAGIGGAAKAWDEGSAAGASAAGRPGRASRRAAGFARVLDELFAPRPGLRELIAPDTVVCRCEGVTAGEIGAAASFSELKLRTRAGQGPCQGRVCAPLIGLEPSARPPLAPVPVAAL